MIVAETERTFPVFSVKAASEELEKSNLPFLLFKTNFLYFIFIFSLSLKTALSNFEDLFKTSL